MWRCSSCRTFAGCRTASSKAPKRKRSSKSGSSFAAFALKPAENSQPFSLLFDGRKIRKICSKKSLRSLRRSPRSRCVVANQLPEKNLEFNYKFCLVGARERLCSSLFHQRESAQRCSFAAVRRIFRSKNFVRSTRNRGRASALSVQTN